MSSSDKIWKRAEVESPCVNLCQVHPQTRLCIGCKRSIDEITNWSRYSHQERAELMDDIQTRQASPTTRRGGRASRLRS
ncbi:MAG: DUF1289 domain-containing protein [Paracoccaceae bacterium]